MQKLITFLLLLCFPISLFGQNYDYLEGYIHASQHYDTYRYREALLLYNELINTPKVWEQFSAKKKLEIYEKAIYSNLKKEPTFNQKDFENAIILANQSVDLTAEIYTESNENLIQQITKYYTNISFAIAKYDLNMAMDYLLTGAKQIKNDRCAKILLGKLDDVLVNNKNPIKLDIDIIQKVDISIALRKERGLENFSAFVTLGVACFQRNLNNTAALCYQEALLISKSSKNSTKLIRNYYLKNLRKIELDKQFEISKYAIISADKKGKLSSESVLVLATYFNNSEKFKDESAFFFQKSFELAKGVEELTFLFVKGKVKGEYIKFIAKTDNAFEVAKQNNEIMEENGIRNINIYTALICLFREKKDKEAFMFFSEKKKNLELRVDSPNQVDLKKLAFNYFENQNYRKAKEKFHTVLKYEGEFALTYHWLIKCNMKLDEKERASNNLSQMVRTMDFATYFPQIQHEWVSILTFLGIKKNTKIAFTKQ